MRYEKIFEIFRELLKKDVPWKWKSTLPNVKCKFKFDVLIYSQKSDLLTYL